jgi:DNA repair protein RecO (recombination protein O)
MLTTTEGIVLTTRAYSEADLIVTYFTLNRGIIKAFAKSPRKSLSRFGSSLEPLTHSRISLMGKEQSMPRVTQSDIIHSFQGIREQFYDYVHVCKLCEIVFSLTPEGVSNNKLFIFFLNALNTLELLKSDQKDVLHLITQIRLLALLGYAPRLKGCGKCSAESRNFYPSLGTTLCDKCSVTSSRERESSLKVSGKTIHFYTHCIGWPMNISGRLRPSQEAKAELSAVLEAHITSVLNKKLLTSDFLAEI